MGKTKGKPDIFTRFATFVPITAPPFPTSGMQPTPYIDIHTHRRSNDPYVIDAYAVGSDGSLPAGPYSAGIHPWEVQRITPDNTSRYRQDLLDALTPRCIAVGEIGLDYYWDKENHDLQKEWFIRQLDLARKKEKPVIIHSREAAADTMEIMKEYASGLRGVIHCYSYSAEMAKEYVKMGYYIGIGGVVTFKNAKKLKQVVQEIPLESIVLETDCPYLAPVPYRGKRNSSLYLPYVAEEIAALKGAAAEDVVLQTEENARKLYGL